MTNMTSTLAELFDKRDQPYFAELQRIGEAIGYGRAQQILGEVWDQRHNCHGRGQMGVTVRANPLIDVSDIAAFVTLAEQCGAEIGRNETEVFWIKFHQPSIPTFATELVRIKRDQKDKT
jgi:hypothetical protein